MPSDPSALEKADLELQEFSRVDKYLEKALSSNPIDSRAGKQVYQKIYSEISSSLYQGVQD